MKKKIRIIYPLLLLMIFNCCGKGFQREEFVGIWKSKDGAVIELKRDGTYIAKKINFNILYPKEQFIKEMPNNTGNWKINKSSDNIDCIVLNSNNTYGDYNIDNTYTIDGAKRSHKIILSFEISNEGMFASKPSYKLFLWVGDPDDMNKYVFFKDTI